MSTYTRKHLLVEARQHEGPKISVISDIKGKQSANQGDYLVTDPTAQQPRGSVYVVAKEDFERDHDLVPNTPRAPERRDYPDYVSHKEVSAVQIDTIEEKIGGILVLHLVKDGERAWDNIPFGPDELKNKPTPQAGWYVVFYGNGYISWSPPQAFEEGYTRA